MPRSILLVEDNEDDVFFFQTAAKKAGWTSPVVVAHNGRQAVEILSGVISDPSGATAFSLVLLDIKMPFMSGLEVLEWIREQAALRFLPVLMLSSSEQTADIKTAYRLGAASYLVKPSNPEELTNMLRVIDAYWLRHNRLPSEPLDLEAHATALGGATSRS